MEYEKFLEVSKQYDDQLNFWSDKLNSFPKLPNGLIPDDVKSTPEYKNARKMYDFYFKLYRELNKSNKENMKRRAIERREMIPKK